MLRKNIYKFEGLECPHCAKKIQDHLNSQESIKRAKLNFKKQIMTIKFVEQELSADELVILFKEVKNIDVKIEKIN